MTSAGTLASPLVPPLHDGAGPVNEVAGGPAPDGRVELLLLTRIDLRFEKLRLGHPSREARVRLHLERGVYLPVLASDRVEAGETVLVDGFKRVRAARSLGRREVLVQVVGLDAVAAVAAILASNSGFGGLTQVEEGLIVQDLHRQHGLSQTEIAGRLDRHKSWVCRRLQLLEVLHPEVLKDVRTGLVTPAVAREVARLPRGNQPPTARAIHEHHLTSREAGRLVLVLKASRDNAEAVLADPRAHLPPDEGKADTRRADPRLGTAGNRLRFQLLRMESGAQQAGIALRERPVSTLLTAECAILAETATAAFRAVQRARLLMPTWIPSEIEETQGET